MQLYSAFQKRKFIKMILSKLGNVLQGSLDFLDKELKLLIGFPIGHSDSISREKVLIEIGICPTKSKLQNACLATAKQ